MGSVATVLSFGLIILTTLTAVAVSTFRRFDDAMYGFNTGNDPRPFIVPVVMAVITFGVAVLTVRAARGSRIALAITFVLSTVLVAVVVAQIALGRWVADPVTAFFLAILMAGAAGSGFLLSEDGAPRETIKDTPQVGPPPVAPDAPADVTP